MRAVLFIAILMSPYALCQSIDIKFSDNVPLAIQNNSKTLINQRVFLPSLPLPSSRLEQTNRSIIHLITEAAKPFGYFNVQCNLTLLENHHSLAYHAKCIMNDPVLVDAFNIHVSGPGKPTIEPHLALPDYAPKIQGVFSSDAYEGAKSYLLSLCHSHGYIKANSENSTLKIDLDKLKAHILINIQTGPQFLFGPISISQNTYHKDLLRSMATFQTSMPYNDSQLAQYKDNLESSGLFKSVELEPQNNNVDNKKIPIQLSYSPIDALQYGLGLGYSTDSDFFYSANVTRNRLTPYGTYFNTNLLSGSDNSYLVSTLSFPRTHPTKDFYTLQATLKKNYIEYVGTDKNFSTSFSHIINHRYSATNSIRRQTALHYSLDHSTVDGYGTSRIQFLYPSLQYDLFYKRPNDHISVYLQNKILGNIEPLLTPCSFVKITAKQKIIFPPLAKTTLQLSFKEGIIAASKSFDTLPLSWYFYTGGSYTVRGFRYQSIGANPHNTIDFNNYLYIASFEAQRHIFNDFYLITFIDLGNATDHITTSKSSIAQGVGLLWKTFAGDLEISLAKPIRNYSSDPSMKPRLNINLSHSFQ